MTNKLAFLVSVGVAAVLAFAGLLSLAFPAGAVAAETVIVEPVRASETGPDFTASGGTDGDKVWVAIRNRSTLEWWAGDGYQPAFEKLWATVDGDGGWVLPVGSLDTGSHSLTVQSFSEGVRTTRSAIRFDVAEPEPEPQPEPQPEPEPEPELAPSQLGTLIMSRSLWGVPQTQSCRYGTNTTALAEGSLSLLEIADLLDERNIKTTHTITVERHDETELTCVNLATLTVPWATLTDLRDNYGWSAISHGQQYLAMNDLDDDAVTAESCGSLTELEDRGFVEASAMFAFPNNRVSLSARTRQIAGSCFDFLREYGSTSNTFERVAAGESVRVRSVSGGSCSAAGCAETHPREYVTPDRVLSEVLGGDGTWGVVQFYKIVVGSWTEGHQQWDCTSPDPDEHWTNQGEIYCLADFLAVVDGMSAAGVDWVSPADVAGLVESGAIG